MTNKPSADEITLGMLSYLVKHPKNPNGIELDKLNKMEDYEIEDAFWEYEKSKEVDHDDMQ